ncbi:transcription factor MYB1R1-like [Silene latifolia]|uniref:transcription factor MYB1R1-like n=1 Tax=Silene latifolia TaxID=37657 RepID=UPI003D778D13
MSEDDGCREVMLFGVRIVADSTSNNHLSQCEQVKDGVSCASTTTAVNRKRKRKRKPAAGVEWTVEEHKLFLKGLNKVGKGNWRCISRNFVKTRTSTQVASHAQKYFNRMNNPNPGRRRRSSIFDIPANSVDQMDNENNLRAEYPEITSASSEANSEMEFTISTPPVYYYYNTLPPQVVLNANTNDTNMGVLSFDPSLVSLDLSLSLSTGTSMKSDISGRRKVGPSGYYNSRGLA